MHDCGSILNSNAKELLVTMIFDVMHPYITIHSVQRFVPHISYALLCTYAQYHIPYRPAHITY